MKRFAISLLCGIGGYANDWNMVSAAFDLAPHPASINPIQARHVDVQKHNVKVAIFKRFNRFIAVAH